MFIKKILIFIFLTFIFSNTFAEYKENNSYITKDLTELNFKANLNNWVVETSWDKFLKSSDYWFSYYKVVRSSTKSNPYYPEDGYIYYTSDIDKTSYIDEKVLKWDSYYRVCAISNKNWKYRFCSKVVLIKNWEKEYTEKVKVEKEYIEKKEVINNSYKKFDILFEKYIKKIESKTSDNSKRIILIDNIINKLSSIKTSWENKEIISYLIVKFKNYKSSLSSDIDSLDSIINNIIDEK